MLYTLGHVKELVAPFVTSGGSCPSNQVVVDRVNEAQRRLLSEGRADWDSTQRHVCLCTRNNCIALPRELESARLVSIDDVSRLVFPVSYQYLENGPMVRENQDYYGKDLLDLGDGWPTFFDIPESDEDLFLVAYMTGAPVLGLAIKVYGRKANGDEYLGVTGLPGFDLPVAQWAGGLEGSLDSYPDVSSSVSLKTISQVVLPAGRKGYVALYAVNPTTRAMYFLSKYHPAETSPSYRRYKILGACGEDGCTTVRVLAKVRHVPLTRDDDVLLVQNLDAIKTMVMAIREENAGNVQASVALEAKAMDQLARQLANKRSGDPIITIQDTVPVRAFNII